LAADLYIGLMSGTSLDGVDAVLVDFATPDAKPRLLNALYAPYDDEIRADLLDVHHEGHDEINRAAQLSNRLAERYAAAVNGLLEAASVAASSVTAIGCHGQTVRHRPELGYTVQLGNPAHLAETTGISVVADFRSRDIAAGGQGAPLVPAFHRAVFALPDRHRVAVNLGGIANLTNLAPGKPVIGFDCGPANMLMDAWSSKVQGARIDLDGAWAVSGTVIPELLGAMLVEPYLALAPPKSTGRELFNYAWLEPKLKPAYAAADVQRSLLEFTCEALARAIETHCPGTQEVLLCGGGARNSALRKRIGERLLTASVRLSDEAGIAAEHVEAMAFAWLARQALLGNSGNLPEVTGARGERILGAIYQA
jgi:anhydro-N-acetylmuramic acid kinase